MTDLNDFTTKGFCWFCGNPIPTDFDLEYFCSDKCDQEWWRVEGSKSDKA